MTIEFPKQEQEHTPQINEELVESFNTFKEYFHPKSDVVYYPSCGIDVSIAHAFPESKIIFVDTDDDVIRSLKKAGYEARQVSSQEFIPETPVDILLLLNPATSPNKPIEVVIENGYVLCNDYHATASELRSHEELKLVAMVRKNDEGKLFIDTEPEGYWEEIDTDEEFQNAPFSWGAADYDEAKIILEQLGLPTNNVVVEYKKLIEQTKEENSKRRQKGNEDDNLSDLLMIVDEKNPGQPIILDDRLPSKKGTVDDLFVYQKVTS